MYIYVCSLLWLMYRLCLVAVSGGSGMVLSVDIGSECCVMLEKMFFQQTEFVLH